MLLTIDVGNTQTVIGIYKGEDLLHRWRIGTHKDHTADELRMRLRVLLDNERIQTDDLRGAVLASVVPVLTLAWCDAIKYLVGKQALVCSAETAAPLFQTNYPNPQEIGADRIADVVAAKALYGAPVIVVDFGTATNMEVVDSQGYFIGGIIAPGLETSSAALFSHATKLASIELVDPQAAFGRSTEQAMQVGIVYGEADRVDGLVRRIFDELGYTAPVVATGGLALRVATLSETITIMNADLTLAGLRLIYEAHEGKSSGAE